MRMLMVGAGATGGFYGGKLLAAGQDVTFLLRDGRARQIRERGLEIVAHDGSTLTLQPRIVSAAQLLASGEAFDLILISTKAYQLAQAMEDLAPAVGAGTMILPILNGMGQLETLENRFGKGAVLGGSVRIVADLDEQGRVLQMTPLDQMSYGELSGEKTARIAAVDEAMRSAGFTALLQADILDALWQKWMILASMGAICILARGNAGQVGAAPFGPAFARAVVEECAAIGTANGYPPTAGMVDEHTRRMTEPGSTLTSSLYRDMLKGAPVEADHILGDLLARAAGVAAPLLTAAYVQLKVYEAARQ